MYTHVHRPVEVGMARHLIAPKDMVHVSLIVVASYMYSMCLFYIINTGAETYYRY